jgi:hypothetical protein
MAAHNWQPRDDKTSKRKSVRALEHDPEKWKLVFRKDHAHQKHDPEKIEPLFRKITLTKLRRSPSRIPPQGSLSPLLE